MYFPFQDSEWEYFEEEEEEEPREHVSWTKKNKQGDKSPNDGHPKLDSSKRVVNCNELLPF